MFRIVLTVFVMLLFLNQQSMAQVLEPARGGVEIVQDARITQLADQYRKMSLKNPETDGYRVQIFFDSGSNSKMKAANVKEEFETQYPEFQAYLSYKEPYYRVRVGDFRSMIEAVGFQKKIDSDYPNAYPVKEKIVQ